MISFIIGVVLIIAAFILDRGYLSIGIVFAGVLFLSASAILLLAHSCVGGG